MARREVFDSIMQGLTEVQAYWQGRLELRTTKLRIRPVSTYTAKRVKSVRQQLKLAQVAFAHLCSVSTKTVEAWEAGTITPSGAGWRP